jgi:hypothetical protein
MIRMIWIHVDDTWPLTNKFPKEYGRVILPIPSSVLSVKKSGWKVLNEHNVTQG